MSKETHILVDGWNVLHSDPSLARLLSAQPYEAAHEALRNRLAPIHDYMGARLTIVYDGRGDTISIVRPTNVPTFSEVFTPSVMTADEFIEQLCSISGKSVKIYVATRDNLLKLTSTTFGAQRISPEDLFGMASQAASALARAQSANNAVSSRTWQSSNAFENLDVLGLELVAMQRRYPLVSKHLKKRAKHMEKIAASKEASSGAFAATSPAVCQKQKKSPAAKTAQNLNQVPSASNKKSRTTGDGKIIVGGAFSPLLKKSIDVREISMGPAWRNAGVAPLPRKKGGRAKK